MDDGGRTISSCTTWKKGVAVRYAEWDELQKVRTAKWRGLVTFMVLLLTVPTAW